MKPVSSLEIPWTDYADAQGLILRYRHLSRAALGENYRVGVAIEELLPGKRSSNAHYHLFEEEHVYILEGTLTLRLGADAYPMQAGDYVCFPAGQRAGHCLVNDSGSTCRYVIVGERHPHDVGVYTDLRKATVRALGSDALFDLAATEAPVAPRPPISSDAVEWNVEGEGPRFGGRSKHLTYAAIGSRDYRVGMLIEAPAPFMRLCPRHYHMLEEEHALILEGRVTLLLGDERHDMEAGDYVCFPAGRKIAHSFMNGSAGPCSYLMLGEHNPNDVCVLPDSNKMEVRALRMPGTYFDMSATRKYFDGEETS